MEILSLSNVFPVRVEAKDESGQLYQQVVFVDVLAKKVYNVSGFEAFDEIAPQILERIIKPQMVKIPQAVQDAMQKQKIKEEQSNNARSTKV